MSGVAWVLGERDGPPIVPPFAMADGVAALFGTIATLAALRHRDRSGKGQWIDLSLLEPLFAFLGPAGHRLRADRRGRASRRQPRVLQRAAQRLPDRRRALGRDLDECPVGGRPAVRGDRPGRPGAGGALRHDAEADPARRRARRADRRVGRPAVARRTCCASGTSTRSPARRSTTSSTSSPTSRSRRVEMLDRGRRRGARAAADARRVPAAERDPGRASATPAVRSAPTTRRSSARACGRSAEQLAELRDAGVI